jgi:hypothetical protein
MLFDSMGSFRHGAQPVLRYRLRPRSSLSTPQYILSLKTDPDHQAGLDQDNLAFRYEQTPDLLTRDRQRIVDVSWSLNAPACFP